MFNNPFKNFDKPVQGTVVKSTEETGWDRVLTMFTPNEFGELSPQLNTVLQVGCMSIFSGALYGGVLHSKSAYLEFFKYNQATVFKDHIEAKKRLQDKVTLGFGKGAFRWAWRLSLFTTSYVGISSAVAVYRDKTGIMEHFVAGICTGLMYKFNMGPRGWLVGGALGMVLGGVAGGSTLAILKLTGMTIDDVRERNSVFGKKRVEKFNEGVKDYMQRENLDIVNEYNKRMEVEKVKNIEKLDDK